MCRERAAQRPQIYSFAVKIAGAALRPFRDTRPLLQESVQACRYLLGKHSNRLPAQGQQLALRRPQRCGGMPVTIPRMFGFHAIAAPVQGR